MKNRDIIEDIENVKEEVRDKFVKDLNSSFINPENKFIDE